MSINVYIYKYTIDVTGPLLNARSVRKRLVRFKGPFNTNKHGRAPPFNPEPASP